MAGGCYNSGYVILIHTVIHTGCELQNPARGNSDGKAGQKTEQPGGFGGGGAGMNLGMALCEKLSLLGFCDAYPLVN